jgi:hypothetical protein
LPEDFAMEDKREDLRDRRWRRHRSMLYATAGLIVALGLGLHVPLLLRWLGS